MHRLLVQTGQLVVTYHTIRHHVSHLGWLEVGDYHHSPVLHLVCRYKLDQATDNLQQATTSTLEQPGAGPYRHPNLHTDSAGSGAPCNCATPRPLN